MSWARLSAVCAAAACTLVPAAAFAAGGDADAPSLVRKNECLTCHEIDQDKEGPSFRRIAQKYRGMTDAERRLVAQMAHGDKARFPDGHEETHKPVKTSPPRDMDQIKELVQWILAQ